ncbi:tetratricopeptide repeat protein [Hymenobacter tibetensis]|uniref:Tetratricopeptide repeat protein n=1 Tax=Hymenobacter tibetensis TaxID=497967 RepID=A0ABY4D4U5_9BACT|nr:tetratricopeptide repeat protein [Hymenobacter tibetensis]UOG76560.1 tetratricopeptide repeat protein [Hymenobacter tibetensis]
MRSIFFATLLAGSLSTAGVALAQATSTAEALVQEGIALYDQGQYQKAVVSYNQALKLEPTNSTALYELALTYNALGRNAEAVELCKRLLKQNADPGPAVYGTYGNALDGLHKPKEAVKMYEEGVKRYPNEGSLYFNLGITQANSLNQLDAAIASMQQAVRCRPEHANSHAALAELTLAQGNRIPALLETMRLLQLEPQSKRAEACLVRLDKMMGQGVKQTGEKSVTISLAQAPVADANRKNSKPDNFAGMDLLLTMATALDLDEKNKNKPSSERLLEKLTTLCRAMGEAEATQRVGFVWQHYAPYFVALEKQGHLPALVYSIQAARAEALPEVQAWLTQHPTQVEALQEWSRTYAWPE